MQPGILYGLDQQPYYRSMYAGSTNGLVSTATAANTATSIAYLFHPSANTKRVEIQKITISFSGNAGNNGDFIEGAFITAENATPGGTSQTTNPLDRADAASTVIFRSGATGAPTRVTGDLLSFGGLGSTDRQIIIDASTIGKPIVLRASVAEGFEIRHVVGASNLASAVEMTVTMFWTET